MQDIAQASPTDSYFFRRKADSPSDPLTDLDQKPACPGHCGHCNVATNGDRDLPPEAKDLLRRGLKDVRAQGFFDAWSIPQMRRVGV